MRGRATFIVDWWHARLTEEGIRGTRSLIGMPEMASERVKKCWFRSLLACAVLAACSATGGLAQTPSAGGEVSLVKSLSSSSAFMRILERRAPLTMVAENGAVGENRISHKHAALQRDVLWLAYRAISKRDAIAMDKVVNALEFGFSSLTPEGNFENGLGASPKKAVGADAFFLQAYCRIEQLISRSTFKDNYSARMAAMNAKLPRALGWLKRNHGELYRQDKAATNRLFFDAIALGLCGKIAGDSQAIALGKKFLAVALDNQRADGTFSENGGYDSSYQAVSLLNLAVLIPYLREKKLLMNALERGAEWELTRIKQNGRVETSGNTRTGVGREGNKEVNYFEVMVALFFAGGLLGDQRYSDAAEDVARFVLRKI